MFLKDMQYAKTGYADKGVPKGSILVLLFQVLINDLAVLHVVMINLCAEDVARTMINAFLQSSSFFISGHPSLMPADDRTQDKYSSVWSSLRNLS